MKHTYEITNAEGQIIASGNTNGTDNATATRLLEGVCDRVDEVLRDRQEPNGYSYIATTDLGELTVTIQ